MNLSFDQAMWSVDPDRGMRLGTGGLRMCGVF